MARLVFGTNADAPAARPRKATAGRAPQYEPKPDTHGTTNESRQRRARFMMSEARNWVADNPDAWAFMVSRSIHETNAEREFGMKQLIEETRRKDFVDVWGKRASLDNTLSPAFARILIEQHPECRRYMRIKRALIDEVK